jgi:hypothetical protein
MFEGWDGESGPPRGLPTRTAGITPAIEGAIQ